MEVLQGRRHHCRVSSRLVLRALTPRRPEIDSERGEREKDDND